MDRLRRIGAKISLRMKLFLLFFILLMITSLLVSYWYYKSSMDNAVVQYSKDVYQNICQSNTIINLKFSKIVKSSETIIQDQNICQIFQNINPHDPYDLLRYDRELKKILARYFDADGSVYSQTIMTNYYTFGEGFLPYYGFQNSELYYHIIDGKGKLVWEPTYSFVHMFHQEDLADCNIDDFRYLFACGRVLNILDNSDRTADLPFGQEQPLLVINFREEFIRDCYIDLASDDIGLYFIVAPDKSIVSASDDKQAKSVAAGASWLPEILEQKTGIIYKTENKEPIVICYDTSQITGWTLVSVTKTKDLIPQVSRNILISAAELVLLFIGISFSLSFFISLMTTKPINKLIAAIKRTEQGDFTNKIPVNGYGEFDNLIRRFNNMNDKIQQLIRENYEVKLHEKEAQIKLLNTQLNPHFLYNTLNLVSCIAIENHCSEISKIVAALSRMLHYTVENNRSMGKLKEELEWLDGYIYIMSCRFEGKLDYSCNVDPALLNCDVPRLFLQPFVENAFVHGFEQMESNCVLRISGWKEQSRYCFLVADNGRGMSAEQIKSVMEGDGVSVGIRNVHQRLKLMYGDEYGIKIQSSPGSGTSIFICLPAQ